MPDSNNFNDFFVESENELESTFSEIKNIKEEIFSQNEIKVIKSSDNTLAKNLSVEDFMVEECVENQLDEDVKKIVEKNLTTYEVIENQIKVSLELLNDVRRMFPHSIISGGAARDWYIGKASKDTDIYIIVEDNTNTEQSKKMLEEATSLRIEKKSSTNESLQSTSKVLNYPTIFVNDLVKYRREVLAIHDVYSTSYKDQDFDLILVKHNIKRQEFFEKKNWNNIVDSIHNTFDFGLCMISYDEKGYYITDKFLKDLNNKTLTLYMDNIISSEIFLHTYKKHLPKMSRKFLDYQVLIEMSDKFKLCFNRAFDSYLQLLE